MGRVYHVFSPIIIIWPIITQANHLHLERQGPVIDPQVDLIVTFEDFTD